MSFKDGNGKIQVNFAQLREECQADSCGCVLGEVVLIYTRRSSVSERLSTASVSTFRLCRMYQVTSELPLRRGLRTKYPPMYLSHLT